MKPEADRTRFLSILLLLVGCASETNTSRKDTWQPIPGASVMPWEQAEAVCEPMLEQGQAAVGGSEGAVANARAKARYRSCMAKNGWTSRAVSARGSDERAAARRKDAEQLEAQLGKSRTKNALTLLVGDAPDCQQGDPGTEICKWQWTRQLPTENVPLQMTCVLPKDGTPRREDSCRYSTRSEAR